MEKDHDQEIDDMQRDRDMLANPQGHGSSPGQGHEATDPAKMTQPFPTPGEEHLSPVEEIEADGGEDRS